MRTIKFRGKRIDTLEWVYGFYLETQMSGVFILGSEIETKKRKDGITMRDKLWQHEVIPESVGQWTGIKNVYEGDITKSVDSNWGYGGEYDRTHDGYLYQVVEFRDGAFYIGDNLLADCSDYEIVGNLIDSPELMEV